MKTKEIRIMKTKDGKYIIEENTTIQSIMTSKWFNPDKWVRWAKRKNTNFEDYVYGEIAHPMVFDTVEDCLKTIKEYVGIMNFNKTNVQIILNEN